MKEISSAFEGTKTTSTKVTCDGCGVEREKSYRVSLLSNGEVLCEGTAEKFVDTLIKEGWSFICSLGVRMQALNDGKRTPLTNNCGLLLCPSCSGKHPLMRTMIAYLYEVGMIKPPIWSSGIAPTSVDAGPEDFQNDPEWVRRCLGMDNPRPPRGGFF